VLAVLAEERRPASEAVHMFEPSPQVLENVRFTNGSPLNNPKVASAIKLCEKKLDGGRLLVRKSGTEPVIRIMAEGENEKLVRDVVKEVAQLIREAGA
jgi:phosphoglucosamine mutase